MRYYRYSGYSGYPEYVSVGERRATAERQLKNLAKKNPNLKPIRIHGRTIATTWWGKSWNSNLERYADYSNRIGRGRSYVRSGSVLDLQITPGKITALVQGSQSQPYEIAVTIDKLSAANWNVIRTACQGSFDSLSELLRGRFPQSLKDLFFEQSSGLFPAPKEIHFDCSCPDWASMCKHIAAVLYGVGARLDHDPSLFFSLREIDIDEVITETVASAADTLLRKAASRSKNVLEDADIGDVFGIQMDDTAAPLPALPLVKPKTPAPHTSTTKATKSVFTKTFNRRDEAVGQKKQRRTEAVKRELAALMAEKDKPVTDHSAKISGPVARQKTHKGDMIAALLKAIGKARTGKSIVDLANTLDWTQMQVRNALARARTQQLVEVVHPGLYRCTK